MTTPAPSAVAEPPGPPDPRRADAVKTGAIEAAPGALPTLLFVVFMNLLGFGMVVPLLPFFAQSFHAAPWQISLIFSAYAMGGFVGEPFWGRLSDRIGRRPVLISTLACNCVTYGLMAFAPNIWAAFAIRFFGGMFSGNGSVVQGYIADVTPPEDRPGKLARIGVAFNIGFIFGPMVSGALARPDLGPVGFRAPFLVSSALAALSALGVALLVKESRARRTGMINQPSRWALTGAALRHPVAGRLLLLTLAAGFAFNGIESVFGFWGQHAFGWGPRQIAIVFGCVGVTNAAAQWFVTGRLSKLWGQDKALAAGMALTVLATLLIPLSRGLVSVTVFMSLMAFGQSVAFPNVGALISRVAHQDRQGQALGLNNAAGALARFLGPLASTYVFSGLAAGPFYLAALVVAPAILLALSAGRAVKTAPLL